MDVSVVIATYNRKELLERCLISLFNQDYPKENYEIIVVDDGSTDGTREMIEEKGYGIRYLYQERKGQGLARNLGIGVAKGEIIIFVDSDVICPKDFILEHVKYHRRYKDIIVDGPAINTRRLDNHGLERFLAKFDFFGASFITMNTSCKKRFLEEAGLFVPEFSGRYGWEDRELGYRLRKLGLKRKKNRRAFVFHYHKEKESLFDITKKKIESGINAILYYKKHPSLKVKIETKFHYLLLDRLINIGNWLEKDILKRLICSNPLLQVLLKKPLLIHAYAKGLREGIRRYYQYSPKV